MEFGSLVSTRNPRKSIEEGEYSMNKCMLWLTIALCLAAAAAPSKADDPVPPHFCGGSPMSPLSPPTHC